MIDLADAMVLAKVLRRPPPEPLSRSEGLWYRGRRVLVTGAGSAAGAALARGLAACAPASLTLIDSAEDQLVSCSAALRADWPALDARPLLGDLSRMRFARAACDTARPDVVFHAGGARHPDLLERDVHAAVLANVVATACTADAARDIGARCVLISSCRAVRPRSVLGATMRLAELVALSRADSTFKPAIVRIGDVVGSHASVVTGMLGPLDRGEPLPIPSASAAGWFTTPAEAAVLALRADIMRLGGRVAWLADAPAVGFADIAGRLLQLAGGRRVPRPLFTYTGVLPWHADLDAGDPETDQDCPAGVGSTPHPPVDPARIRRLLRSIKLALSVGDSLAVLTDLCAAIPEYEVSVMARHAAGESTLNAMLPVDAGFGRLVA